MQALTDTSRLCIHTITNKPWGLKEALDYYAEGGVSGISIWQNAYQEMGAVKAGDLVKEYPIDVVSTVRGGFFAHHSTSNREKAIDDNKKLIDESAALGSPLLVLVCGSDPSQSLEESRNQIRDGLEILEPYAKAANVKLGIEPLHPLYADTRSAINTLKTANDIAESILSPFIGVVFDVYHLWWEENLKQEIMRCGKNKNLLAFHVCDWKVPTMDLLNDRGLMGEGCIPIRQIRTWVEEAGFTGFCEVEIFSDIYWEMDQKEFLNKIIKSYHQYV